MKVNYPIYNNIGPFKLEHIVCNRIYPTLDLGYIRRRIRLYRKNICHLFHVGQNIRYISYFKL